VAKLRAISDEYRGSGPRFSESDLGMAVQVLENRHGRETMQSAGAGFTLVFVQLATLGTGPLSLCEDLRDTPATIRRKRCTSESGKTGKTGGKGTTGPAWGVALCEMMCISG